MPILIFKVGINIYSVINTTFRNVLPLSSTLKPLLRLNSAFLSPFTTGPTASSENSK